MSENKHIEINFKNNDKSNETSQNQSNKAKLVIDHMPPCTTERQEEKTELTSEDVKFKELEREKARVELRKQEKQNPPIRHKDSSNYNTDLNAKDDKLSPEIVYETLEKQKCKNEPITDRIKDVVNFDEAKKIMNNMDAIYADASVESDPPYDPNNTNPNFNFNSDIRNYNIGTSDYSKHKIQPWDIWEDYNLNPWDADIVKRVLRKKELPGLDNNDSRIEDYQKIIHICLKRIEQIKNNVNII